MTYCDVAQPLTPDLHPGGEAEAGGAHAQREAHPAGHQLPLPSQLRVSLQGVQLGQDPGILKIPNF